MKIYKSPLLYRKIRQIFLAVLVFLMMLYLNGCTTTRIDNCPPWPPATKAASTELRNACGKSPCPHVFEWLNRLYVLRDQLKECR